MPRRNLPCASLNVESEPFPELVGDPLNNLLVQGPHPMDHRRLVFHQFELCDAVSGECYEIEGVKVQNFLLPGWFARNTVAGARNDFLGRVEPKHDDAAGMGIMPGDGRAGFAARGRNRFGVGPGRTGDHSSDASGAGARVPQC